MLTRNFQTVSVLLSVALLASCQANLKTNSSTNGGADESDLCVMSPDDPSCVAVGGGGPGGEHKPAVIKDGKNNTPTVPKINSIEAPKSLTAAGEIEPIIFLNSGAPAVTCEVSPLLPLGLVVSLHNGGCQISGTPLALHPPTLHTVTAVGSGGSRDSATLTLSIERVTTAPSLVLPPPQNYVASVEVAPLLITNLGLDAVSCVTSPALPSGLSIEVHDGSCRIVGTPVASGIGTYTFTAKAADNSESSITLEMTVAAANPPALANGANQTFIAGVLASAVSFTNTGAAIMSCSVSPALPAGLSLNLTTCEITGTPAATHPATLHTVTARAADGSSSTATVSITVNAPNPPVLASQTAKVFATTVPIAAFAFTNTGAPIVSCSISPALPAGLSVNPATCEIGGTPTTAQAARIHTVTALAADGSSDTATVNITVNVANPPAIGNQAAKVFATGVGVTSISFVSSGAPVVSCSISPALPAGLSLDATTCEISGTPTVTHPTTTHTVTAVAADGSSDTATVSVTVNLPNPPILADESAKVFTQSVAVSAFNFANTGAAVASCSIAPALPAGLSLSATTCEISGTPTVIHAATTHTVTAIAADGSNDTATVSITVNAAVPPVIADQSAKVFATMVAITPFNFTNTGAAVTSCSVSPALPAGLALNTATCEISGTPTVTQAAVVHTVTALAADGSFDTATVSITVVAANPPILADQSAKAFVTTVAITSFNFTNTGAAVVSCSISPALPNGLSLDTSTCEVSGTPAATQAATTHTVTALAADGSSDSAVVSITVGAANPPILTNQSAKTFVTTVAAPSFNFTNTGALIVSCTISPALPSGLSLNTSTCEVSGTPTITQTATLHTVTALAADGSSGSATVSITVNAANPPILANAAAKNFTQNVATAAFNFVNTGAAVVSCSVSPALPAGLSLNASTCQISGTPTATQAATTHSVTALAADGSSGSATVSITVNAASPPNLANEAAKIFTQGDAITAFNFANTGAAVTSCSVSPALPSGLSLNTATCEISGTPTVTQAATEHTVTALAADGSGDTATVSITVNANHPALPDLVGHWRLDEVSASGAGSIQDSSGNNHAATPYGNVTYGTAGISGNGFTFDGSTGYIEVPDHNALDFGVASAGFTVSTWFKTSSNTRQTILCKREYNSPWRGYHLQINSGTVRFELNDNGYHEYLNIGSGLADNTWHQIIWSVDYATKLASIYIDGVKIDTINVNAFGGGADNNRPLLIGGHVWGTYLFNGSLDDFKIFNAPVNDAQAEAIYSVVVDQVAKPTFSVAGGVYTTGQSVSLDSTTPGATIYYTTNGTTPTTSSTLYTSALDVDATATIKVLAVKAGLQESFVAEAYYVIDAAATTSVRSPASAATVTGPGYANWFDENYIVSLDTAVAQADLSMDDRTDYLRASNFGFSLPGGATIHGITVAIYKGGYWGSVFDEAVRIVKGGTIGSTDASKPGAWSLNSIAISTYGSSTSLWGETWTAADINSANFGVAIAARGPDWDATAHIDTVRITVHYSP